MKLSRCKACDKILESSEMRNSTELCWECFNISEAVIRDEYETFDLEEEIFDDGLTIVNPVD